VVIMTPIVTTRAAPGRTGLPAHPRSPGPELIAPAGLLGERGTVSPAGY
jgi:hypothetical protein